MRPIWFRNPSVRRSTVRFSLVYLLLIVAASPVVAQDPTPTPNRPMLELLLQAAEAQIMPEATAVPAPPYSIVNALVNGDIPYGRGEDGAFTIGDPDAPITIIEFADWSCPHCQTYRATIDQLLQSYVLAGLAQFEFRMFPTAGGQQTAALGVIAECAALNTEADEGAGLGFWRAYEALYVMAENDEYFAENVLINLSDRLEMDAEALLECAQGIEVPQVAVDLQLAVDIGLTGTPGVLVRYPDAAVDEIAFIELDGVTYNRGGVPLTVLDSVITAANDMPPFMTNP
ncbi:MAG: thioredoxin domain-containing protein [bacterium]|nr:thioredoxin domain-containing protein [bacterium]